MTIRSTGAIAILILAAAMTRASAHITLLNRQAVPGAPYKAVFVVPHGCGESATVKLDVTIPPGVLLIKPMAKPSWQIDIVRKTYAKPWVSSHGAKLTEGVTEVIWSGRLPNSLYDEFVLTTFLSSELAAGTTLYFPAIQTCETGEHRWIEIPGAGQDKRLDEPAPALKLLPRDKIGDEEKP